MIKNVRLWDPAVVQAAFERNQGSGLRDFYSINDVDVDRYTIDGETTQVNIAARDLSRDGIPQPSWVSQHLTYTHGFGAVVSPANAVSRRRPARARRAGRAGRSRSPVRRRSTEPRVYFGEDQSGYVIVNSGVNEVDFTDDDGNTRFTNYTGQDGVQLNSFVRRAAFALRFGDINPLISSNVKSDSKLLLQRNVDGPGRGGRPVPAVRQRPVPGHRRRPDRLRDRRLHDDRPLPERPAGRQRTTIADGSGLEPASSTTCATR